MITSKRQESFHIKSIYDCQNQSIELCIDQESEHHLRTIRRLDFSVGNHNKRKVVAEAAVVNKIMVEVGVDTMIVGQNSFSMIVESLDMFPATVGGRWRSGK